MITETCAPVAVTPLLICAATPWEAKPLAATLHLAASQKYSGSWSGQVCKRPVTILITGIGAERTNKTLESFGVSNTFSCVISYGFAGALQPGMKTGDIVADLRGADANLPIVARTIADSKKLILHFGRIVHTQTVLGPEEKHTLGKQERACAVDMETQAIAAWAKQRSMTMLAVRVVLDTMDDPLPRTAPVNDTLLTLVSYVLTHISELPLLIATGIKHRKASAALTTFLTLFLEAL